jgi:hypothetical protein
MMREAHTNTINLSIHQSKAQNQSINLKPKKASGFLRTLFLTLALRSRYFTEYAVLVKTRPSWR